LFTERGTHRCRQRQVPSAQVSVPELAV
jgi:hypothetical protein